MKITKKSWHYRFINFFDTTYSNNIEYGGVSDCQYIRKLIGTFILSLCIFSVICLFTYILFLSILLFPIAYIFDISSWLPGKDNLFGEYIPVAIAGYTCIFMGVFAIAKVRFDLNKSKSDSNKPDNIFVSYIKAKKEKICSRVELINEEESK